MSDMIAIIPARGGSKRVKNKNMRLLGGKPLIQWTLEAAKSAACISQVYVTTEDPEIATFCDGFGVSVIERDAKLSHESIHASQPTYAALKELNWTGQYIAMLLPTSPFRTAKHIEGAYTKFSNVHATCVLGVMELGTGTANIVTVDTISGTLEYPLGKKQPYLQRADLTEAYAVNGAIFMAETRFFLRTGDFHSGRSSAFIMSRESSLEIDTEEDFVKAEALIK